MTGYLNQLFDSARVTYNFIVYAPNEMVSGILRKSFHWEEAYMRLDWVLYNAGPVSTGRFATPFRTANPKRATITIYLSSRNKGKKRIFVFVAFFP